MLAHNRPRSSQAAREAWALRKSGAAWWQLALFSTVLLLAACARDHMRPGATPWSDAGEREVVELDAAERDAALRREGTAEGRGTVAGTSMTVKHAHFGWSNLFLAELVATTGPHFEVALSDRVQACGAKPSAGQILTIDLFQDPSAANSQVTEPGEYAIWNLPTSPTAGKEPLPNDNLSIAVWSMADGTMNRLAHAGQVAVTGVSEAGLSGEFDLTFEDGRLRGKFSAPFCESWKLIPGIPARSSR